MTSRSAPAPAPTPASMRTYFDIRVDDMKIPKSDINALILDYLTMEGYPDVAAKFSKEANLPPNQPDEDIRARQAIQLSILSGNIGQAIESLNDLHPEILDNDQALHFSLLRLQLVELIRTCTAKPNGDITPALEFATTQLGPRAPTHPKFIEDLEKTMALLVFPHDDSLDPSLATILHPSLRQEVADNVNRAILMQQCGRREAALQQLVKMRVWSEETSRDNGKNIPPNLSIGLSSKEEENGHEHDAMITS